MFSFFLCSRCFNLPFFFKFEFVNAMIVNLNPLVIELLCGGFVCSCVLIYPFSTALPVFVPLDFLKTKN